VPSLTLRAEALSRVFLSFPCIVVFLVKGDVARRDRAAWASRSLHSLLDGGPRLKVKPPLDAIGGQARLFTAVEPTLRARRSRFFPREPDPLLYSRSLGCPSSFAQSLPPCFAYGKNVGPLNRLKLFPSYGEPSFFSFLSLQRKVPPSKCPDGRLSPAPLTRIFCNGRPVPSDAESAFAHLP